MSSSLSSTGSILTKEALDLIPKSRLASLGQWVVTATLVVSIAGVIIGAMAVAPYILVAAVTGFMASAIAFYAIHKWKQLKVDEALKGSLIEKIDGLTSVRKQLEDQITNFEVTVHEITEELSKENEKLTVAVTELNEKINRLTEANGLLEEQINRLTEANSVLNKKIKELGEVNQTLIAGIQDFIQSKNSLQELVDRSTTSLDGIQGRMEKTASLQEASQQKHEGFLTRLEGLVEKLGEISKLQNQNKAHIAFLENLKTMATGKGAAIQNYLTSLRSVGTDE